MKKEKKSESQNYFVVVVVFMNGLKIVPILGLSKLYHCHHWLFLKYVL